MFSKSKSASNNDSPAPQPPHNGTFSVIAQGVTLSGTLLAQGDVHIDGVIEGNVQCARLALGETGRIKGALQADEAQISGEVIGPISAKHLTLEKSARVQGDLSYENLIMHAGARTEGRLALLPNENGLKLIVGQGSE